MEKQFELHKERDFSGIFSDGVNFLKAHFKQILRCFVLIIAPLYVLATVLVTLFSTSFINLLSQPTFGDPYGTNTTPFSGVSSALSILGIYLLYGIAVLLAITTIYGYIKIYNKKTDEEKITPNEVWKEAGPSALKLFGYFVVYIIVFMIPLWLVFFLFGLIAGVFSLIPVIGPIILILGMVFLMLVLFTYTSVLIPVIVYEKAGIFGSLSRAASLLSGSFWSTMGVAIVSVFLVQMIFYGIYFLFLLLMQSFNVFTGSPDLSAVKILIIGFAIVAPIILFLGYIFQYSISSFLYYSLLEKLDHVGLNRQVESMNEEDTDKPAEEY